MIRNVSPSRSRRAAVLATVVGATLAVLGGVSAAADSTTHPSLRPATVELSARTPVLHTIASTFYDTIFIGGDGKVYGTGRNELGEITGSAQRTEPAPLTGLPTGVRAVEVAGEAASSLVLGSNGVVYGTGAGEEGQITGTSNRSTLTKLTGLPTGVKATELAAGNEFVLVLGSDGKVYGTGDNSDGELTGSTFEPTTLTLLTGLGRVRAVGIAAGDEFSLVLGANGRIYGAGQALYGNEIGPPVSPGLPTTLKPFDNLPFGAHIIALSASGSNVVMLASDGTAYADGTNAFGQLGYGATDSDEHKNPVTLPVSDVVGISAGPSDIALLQAGGAVLAAGYNGYSQLTGTTTPVLNFQPLALASSFGPSGPGKEVVLTNFTILVRDSLGIIYGAGDNTYGQLTGTAASYPSLIALGGQKVINTSAPTITGTAKVGHTLTAHSGAWRVSASHYVYQWLRNGAAIHSATKTTYKLVTADKAKKISVRVTASRSGFTTGTATSVAHGPVYGKRSKRTRECGTCVLLR